MVVHRIQENKVDWKFDRIFANTPLQANLEDFYRIVDLVTVKHGQMLSLSDKSNLNEETVTAFAEWAVSNKFDAIQNLQGRLYVVVTGNDGRTGLLASMANHFKVSRNMDRKW